MDEVPPRAIAPIFGTVAFLFLAPGFFGVFVPWYATHWQMGGALLGFGPGRWLGAALVSCGAMALLEAFARFAVQGRGTPAPLYPTKILVVSGSYRYVRNPMYLAVTALIVGQGILLGHIGLLIYGAMFIFITHLFVLAYEEPTLRLAYGLQYDTYAANVRRWLPRLTPWQGGESSR